LRLPGSILMRRGRTLRRGIASPGTITIGLRVALGWLARAARRRFIAATAAAAAAATPTATGALGPIPLLPLSPIAGCFIVRVFSYNRFGDGWNAVLGLLR
jgi:hypothetical protein